jgi:outer membrane protein insertion porin family
MILNQFSSKALTISLALTCSFFPLEEVLAATITGIRISGNKRIEAETIMSYIPLKVGSSYDEMVINQAHKDLHATGYFTDVTIRQEGTELVIDVIENALINKIAFEGNSKLKDDKLNEEIQLRPREVLSRTKIQTAVQRILDIYKRMGRFSASVEPKVIKLDENRVDLVFEINEGEVTNIRKIIFKGNKQFDASKLEKAILSKRARWYRFFANDDTYDPDRFIADQQMLRQFYYDHGYPDFRIISAVAELSADQKDLFLTFTVEEGELYTFGAIKIDSQIKRINTDQLTSELYTVEGKTFSAKEVEKTITKLTEAISSQGYAFAEVIPNINKNREKSTIDITYEIKEGPRTYVERIDILGNDRTRDEVIRREMRIHEGDAYNATFVKRAEHLINELGYFKKAEIITEQGSSPDKTRLLVKVEEQPTGELGIAGGFSTLDGPLANIHFTEQNLMGTGRIFYADFTVARKKQDFDIGLTDPYFLGYSLEAGANLFHTRSTRIDAFTQLSKGGAVHIGYDITEFLYQTLNYSLRQDSISHIDKGASQYIKQQKGDYTNSSIGQTLSYDKRDSRREPTSGYVLSLSNSFAGLGGNVSYLKNAIGASVFYTPFEDITLNVRGSAGIIVKTGKPIRIVDSVMLGYDSFRGFEYGGIGPRDARTKDPLGGTRYWTSTVEIVFPIGLPNEFGVKGAAFTDLGSLWKAGTSKKGVKINDSKNIRVSAGAGLSWVSPVGPLRLDYAIPIVKEKFDREQRISFGFSTRF